MRIIEVSDELYDLLAAAASRRNHPDIASFLSGIAEVREERQQGTNAQRREAEHNQIEALSNRPLGGAMFWQKFAAAMGSVYKVVPDRFNQLEGLTRENGRTIYVSKDEARIRNSAEHTHPVQIKDSIWFINAQINQQDAERVIDTARSILGLSAGFGEELKQKTIFAEPLERPV